MSISISRIIKLVSVSGPEPIMTFSNELAALKVFSLDQFFLQQFSSLYLPK